MTDDLTRGPAEAAHPATGIFDGLCMAHHIDQGGDWHCLRPEGHDGDCDQSGTGHTPGPCTCRLDLGGAA